MKNARAPARGTTMSGSISRARPVVPCACRREGPRRATLSSAGLCRSLSVSEEGFCEAWTFSVLGRLVP